MIKIETIFTSFIATTSLSDIDNNELIKYCYDCKENFSGVVKSNAGGWQSDSLTAPNKEIGRLVDQIHFNLTKVAECWKLKTDKNTVSLENIWININPLSAFNRPHVHPKSVFSGTYYVKADEQVGGGIVFLHPAINFLYHINPDTVSDWNDFTSGTWRIQPKPGDLIIFPSYLNHYVEPNLLNTDRISIAFNAGFTNL